MKNGTVTGLAAATVVGYMLFGGGTTGGLAVVPEPATSPPAVPAGGVSGAGWDKVPASMRPLFASAAAKSGCKLATPALLAAIAETESGFNPRAVSPVGAKGVMQIMDNTKAAAKVSDPFDPAQAIPGAARILCAKEVATRGTKHPVLVRTLAAYNGGEGRVGSFIPVGMQRYAEKVIGLSRKYEAAPAPGAGRAGAWRAGMGQAAMERELRRAFPDLAITSRFRPGSVTRSGKASYHSMGRALDIEPRMEIFNWLHKNVPNATELIFAPAADRNLWHGKPHRYNAGTLSDHYCVPLDVPILTRRGWVTYDQLVVGDETPGLDWVTGQTVWTRVTEVNVFDSAEIVETGTRGWWVQTTPAHRWVARHMETGKLSWTTTGEVNKKTSWLVAAPFAGGPGLPLTDAECELLGWLYTDGGQFERTEVCSYDGCSNFVAAKQLCGSHRRQQLKGTPLRPLTRGGNGSSANLAVHAWQSKPSGVARLRELLPQGHASWNGKGFRIRAEYARDLMVRAGITHVKDPAQLTQVALAMSLPQRRSLLDGIISGDGTQSPNGKHVKILKSAGPVSEAIATVAYLCGRRPSVHDRDPGPMRGAFAGSKRNRQPAVTGLCHPSVSTWRTERRSVGRGAVWCPTTALGTWTARFGSNPVLTGNSHIHLAM